MGRVSLVTALVTTMAAASGTLTPPAQRDGEAAYLAARDSAIRSLGARVEAGEQFPIVAHDSALRSLEGRLRVIIGPVHAKGFSGPGRIDLEDLFPEPGFGMLDALAAVYQYGSIALSDTKSLGVVQAIMVRIGQDDSPLPPDKLLLTVARGRSVMIVESPLVVTIPPPRRCTVMRDSLYKRAGAARERYFGSSRTDTAALHRSDEYSDSAESAYRQCYNDRAPLNPAFKRIVTQARSMAAALTRA